MNRYDIEQIYQDFWKDIICDADGNINVEQLKKELYDFYVMIQEVPKVYYAVTGGILSKCLYSAETVLDYFREKYEDKAWAVDLLEDDWDFITAECKSNEDYKKALFEYFEIKGD